MQESAASGEMTEVFSVYKFSDGTFECCFVTTDLDDMLVQVRTEVIHAQLRAARISSEAKADDIRH